MSEESIEKVENTAATVENEGRDEDVQDVKKNDPAPDAKTEEKPEPDGKDGKKSDKEAADDSDSEAPKPFAAKDLALPKGFEYDEGIGKRFEGVVTKYGLSGEAAGELAKLYFELIGESQSKMDESLKAAQKASAEATAKRLADEEAEWLRSSQADEEIGGLNWKTTKANVDRALRTLKAEPFAKLMQGAGYDNHPEVLRFLSHVGAALAEDSLGGGRSGHTQRLSDAEVFYGKKEE